MGRALGHNLRLSLVVTQGPGQSLSRLSHGRVGPAPRSPALPSPSLTGLVPAPPPPEGSLKPLLASWVQIPGLDLKPPTWDPQSLPALGLGVRRGRGGRPPPPGPPPQQERLAEPGQKADVPPAMCALIRPCTRWALPPRKPVLAAFLPPHLRGRSRQGGGPAG